MGAYKKQVRRFHEPGDIHEFTFSCYRRMPLLVDEGWRRMLAESIDRAMIGHDFRLVAFVFMPEHVHLMAYPTCPAPRIDLLLKAIKRPFSARVKQELASVGDPLLDTLTIRERPGVFRFRYWQEGGGYDRNLGTERAILGAIDYIHLNPVRRGLCPGPIDWKWSSARHYLDSCAIHDPDIPSIHGLPPAE